MFKKGQSGNPVGRPKGSKSGLEKHRAELRRIFAAECTVERVRRWFANLERIGEAGEEDKDRINAYKLLLSYALGAPTQDINVKEDIDGEMERLRAEARAALQAAACPKFMDERHKALIIAAEQRGTQSTSDDSGAREDAGNDSVNDSVNDE